LLPGWYWSPAHGDGAILLDQRKRSATLAINSRIWAGLQQQTPRGIARAQFMVVGRVCIRITAADDCLYFDAPRS
jgi:hypothetical protein